MAALVCAISAGAAGCNRDPLAGDLDAGVRINGHPFALRSQGAVEVTTGGDVPLPAGWYVELSDQYNGCWAIMNAPAERTLLQLHFSAKGPGIYEVTEGNTLFIVGRDEKAATPTVGKLELRTADARHLVGTYDVTFATGERLAGPFDAELCR